MTRSESDAAKYVSTHSVSTSVGRALSARARTLLSSPTVVQGCVCVCVCVCVCLCVCWWWWRWNVNRMRTIGSHSSCVVHAVLNVATIKHCNDEHMHTLPFKSALTPKHQCKSLSLFFAKSFSHTGRKNIVQTFAQIACQHRVATRHELRTVLSDRLILHPQAQRGANETDAEATNGRSVDSKGVITSQNITSHSKQTTTT